MCFYGVLLSKGVVIGTNKLKYHVIVEGILMYGAGTWSLTKRSLDKLKVVEMDFSRDEGS